MLQCINQCNYKRKVPTLFDKAFISMMKLSWLSKRNLNISRSATSRFRISRGSEATYYIISGHKKRMFCNPLLSCTSKSFPLANCVGNGVETSIVISLLSISRHPFGGIMYPPPKHPLIAHMEPSSPMTNEAEDILEIWISLSWWTKPAPVLEERMLCRLKGTNLKAACQHFSPAISQIKHMVNDSLLILTTKCNWEEHGQNGLLHANISLYDQITHKNSNFELLQKKEKRKESTKIVTHWVWCLVFVFLPCCLWTRTRQ